MSDPGTPELEDPPLKLRSEEVRMLRTLSQQLRRRLEAGHRAGDDPVVARLFPPAIRDDEAEDRNARSLIHDDVLRQRLAHLDQLLAVLGEQDEPVLLTDDQPQLLLGVLNDLRLSLAVSAGLDRPKEERGELDATTEQAAAMLDWMAWWQERVLRDIDPDALRFYDEESDLSA